jgi:replicative DNA helicase
VKEANMTTALTTGFDDLDALLSGWRRGQLVILAARPGMGQVALALQFAGAAAAAGAAVAVCAWHVEGEFLVRRLAVAPAQGPSPWGVPPYLAVEAWPWASREGQPREESRRPRVEGPALALDAPGQPWEALKAAHPGLGLLIVTELPYRLHLGTRKGCRIGHARRAYLHRLKELARRLDLPVIALLPVRNVESRYDKRPTLRDLHEDATLRAQADVLLLLYRSELYDPDPEVRGTAELAIQRLPHGKFGRIALRTSQAPGRFRGRLEGRP